MIQKFTLLRLSLLMILALALVACGAGAQTGAPPAQKPAGPTVVAPAPVQTAVAPKTTGVAPAPVQSPAAAKATAAGPAASTCPDTARGQQVTMWSPLTGPDGRFMTQLADRYSAENGLGIKVSHLPQPELYQKLNAAAAARNLPDLTIIHMDSIPEQASRNVLKPFTPAMLTILGNPQSQFPEAVWDASDYKGQHWALPLDVHPLVLYYNKDLFRQAGLAEPGDKPMSKADFERAVEALNKNGIAGVAIGTGFQASALFQTLIRQFGGAMANDDGTRATYNSEAGVRALTYLADMKQKTTPQVSGAGDPEVKLFQQGRAGMVIHGPWHITDMQRLPFVGFAPVPQIGDRYAVWGGSHQVALTTEDPAKQAAGACWMNWLSLNSLEWAKAGQVPVRNAVRTSAQLKTEAPAIAAVAESAASVTVWPKVPGIVTALWAEGSEQAINAVLLGQKTDIKAALDEAAAKSNQLIEANAQRYR